MSTKTTFKILKGALVALFFVFSTSLFAQIDISGKTVDARNGEDLPFVNVLVIPLNYGTSTNLSGRFYLPQLKEDSLQVVFSYVGYKQDTFIYQKGINTSNLLIKMERNAVSLESVEIVGSSNQVMEIKSISQISLNPKAVSSVPNLGEADIFRTLQLMPGVSGASESSSGLFVRGGTPDQNLILLDGINIYHVDHFFGVFSAFNSEAIKDVQLYKGGFEARYGGRVSSVVDMTSKAGNKNKPALNFNANMLSANLVVESPLPKNFGSILVAARRSYTDVLKSPTYNSIFDNITEADQADDPGFGIGGANTVEPDFFFYDMNAKLSLTPTKKDVISINYFQSGDNLDNSSIQDLGFGGDASLETTDLTNWGNRGASLKWLRQWNPKVFNRFVASYSRYQSDYELQNLFKFDTLEFNFRTVQFNEIEDFSLRNDLEIKLGKKHEVKTGFWITNNSIKYTNVIDDTVQVQDQNDQGNTYAAYIQDDWILNDKMKLNAGLRYSYFDVTERFYAEPRLSFSAFLSKRIKFKAAWGIYHQFVNRVILENIFGGSRDFWLLSSQDRIPVQFSQHYIAGLSWENKNYLIDVEFYRKNMGGLVEYSLRFGEEFDQEQDFDDLFFNGVGQVNGVDLLLQKKFGKFNGWISYSLSKVEYSFPDIQLNPYPALHDQRHEAKLVAMYKWKRFDFSTVFVYGTGRPYTAPVGLYELELVNGYEQKYIHVGDKNSSRLPDYHRMDIAASYTFNIWKIKNKVGISVFNLYNRRNIRYRRFQIQNFDPETLQPIDAKLIQSDIQLLGIVPNFFINISF